MKRIWAWIFLRLMRMKAMRRRTPDRPLSVALMAGRFMQCAVYRSAGCQPAGTPAACRRSSRRLAGGGPVGRLPALLFVNQIIDDSRDVIHDVVARGPVVVADHAVLVGDGELGAVEQRLSAR